MARNTESLNWAQAEPIAPDLNSSVWWNNALSKSTARFSLYGTVRLEYPPPETAVGFRISSTTLVVSALYSAKSMPGGGFAVKITSPPVS